MKFFNIHCNRIIKKINLNKIYLVELIIIFLLLFTYNNYLGYEDITIKADGKGYYDYLPALFIYADFPYKNNIESTGYSDRVNKLAIYVEYKGNKINKYPCGTSVLLSPFFYYAHITAPFQGFENNGFTRPYQKSVFYAAIFYLFLALIFLRKLLSLYNLSGISIFLVQLFAVFSTSLTYYTNYEASFSHVYSFFAITTFLFFTKSYFLHKKIKHFLWACALLGLIVILRQINVIIILFIPFLAGSYKNLKVGIIKIIKNKWGLVEGVLLFSGIASIQLFLWYLQTGNFFVYSYQGEGFNFLSPAFISILFSYKKGLFIYTPILFISLISCFVFLKNKQFYLFFSWLIFFIILTYILSSWHCWVYGGSYGLRAYIDFYSVFFILLAILIDKLKIWSKLIIILISVLTIPVNIIQTKQYKEYILHWIDMDKEKYWNIFLRQEDRFKGILWKRKYFFNQQTTTNIYSISINDLQIESNVESDIYIEYSNNIDGFDKVNIIQVVLDNKFDTEQDALMELSIRDSLTHEVYYFHKLPLIHYWKEGLNKFHCGEYNYEFLPIVSENNKIIRLKIFTKDKEVVLKNLEINFLEYHL